MYEKAHEAIRAKPVIERKLPVYDKKNNKVALDKKARKAHKVEKFAARTARI